MLMFVVGLVLARVFSAGELRRISRSAAPLEDRVLAMTRSGSTPASLGLVLGVLCAGEALLELPPLREAWTLSGFAIAFVFRLCCMAIWADAYVVTLERVTGRQIPYVPTMVGLLRLFMARVVGSYVLAAIVLQVLIHGLSGGQAFALYVGCVLLTAVGAPLLHRLGQATRPPTEPEQEVLARIADTYGLRLGRVRVQRNGMNGSVAGVSRGSQIFIGDQLMAGPEDELAAVLAHEVAHRDRHHIAWQVMTIVATVVVMLALAYVAVPIVGDDQGALAAILATAFLLPFARSSLLAMIQVQQEYSADAFAAATVGAEPMARMLSRHDDGIPLGGRGTWRYHRHAGHPTLAERLAALGVRPAAAR